MRGFKNHAKKILQSGDFWGKWKFFLKKLLNYLGFYFEQKYT